MDDPTPWQDGTIVMIGSRAVRVGTDETAEWVRARLRAERIARGLRVFADAMQEIQAAYAARDWATLGYESWDDYIRGEYGDKALWSSPTERRRVIQALGENMSTRAIAAVVNVSQSTVQRELNQSNSAGQGRRLGIDGKQRPARQPRAAVPEPEATDDRELAMGVEDDPVIMEPVAEGCQVNVWKILSDLMARLNRERDVWMPMSLAQIDKIERQLATTTKLLAAKRQQLLYQQEKWATDDT